MNKLTSFKLFGNINKAGTFDIDESTKIIDILKNYAEGMVEDKNLEITQIGGPLGVLVAGEELLNQLSYYKDNMSMNTIMFLNERFCPVDFTKFFLKHIRVEMGIKNEELKVIEGLIEELSSGKVRKYTYDELLNEVNTVSEDELVIKVKNNIKFLMNRYENIFLEHFENKKCSASICYRLFSAQCINSCPAEINIPGYIALMSEGEDKKAYELMRQNNPLSLICGKICARPCEARCRRGEIEKTVGVRALKHYAASTTLDKEGFTERKNPSNGKKVGIIGAGPSGLSAAYYLAKTGYEVDIYEKYPVVGGMLAVGVPSYRLSQVTIDKEVKLIENLGVNIFTNTEVGRDININEIYNKYDSVVLSTGCHIANIFSEHIENLESAIDFLREVKLENRTRVGENVVVIGGGDVAMDTARSALRLGAKNVTAVSLESYYAMPASNEEKEEAIEEGIVLINGYGAKEIIEDNNVAKSIKLKKCSQLYDINNKFSPVYDENDIKELKCNHIILAIGQRSDLSYIESTLAIEDNRLKLNNYETSKNGVFVAGDIRGTGSAIKAIAEGKKVAEKVDTYLNGDGLFVFDKIEIPNKQLHYSIWDTDTNYEKVELFSPSCKNPFSQNKRIFTEEEARLEALRCMRCDRNSRQ